MPLDRRGTAVESLTQGGTARNVVPPRDGGLLYTLNSLQAPDDLYRMDRSGSISRLTNVNGDNGLIANKESNLTNQSKDIDSTIATMELKITDDQNRLNAEFVAMETAQATINQQKQYLNAAFGSSSSNGSGSGASSTTSG